MSDHFDEDDALRALEEKDNKFKVNQVKEEAEESVTKEDVKQPPKSLGKAASFQEAQPTPADSPWKILSLNLLPSQGLMYPDGTELLIRSAKTKEIRHWSTIDEHDPIDVREKINYVLTACTSFKVKGRPGKFTVNDFCDIDRYYILFRIYEMTFPNQENKLWANIRCTNPKCNHVNRAQVTSKNLKGFEYPEEIMKWYSEEERCFVIHSEKLGETIRIYLPTLGVKSMFRRKKKEDIQNGIEIDEAFYKFAPYLVNQYRGIDSKDLGAFKLSTYEWPENKFVFIHKFTELLEKSAVNKAACTCEKCSSLLESSIFLGGSFTVKDIFIISAGLDELI